MKKRDPASFQQTVCFSGEELLAYRTGGLSAEKRARVFYHLNGERCRRCRELYLLLGRGETYDETPFVGRKMVERLKQAPPARREYTTPCKIGSGQIWTTSPRPKNARGETLASLGAAFPVLVVSSGNGEKTLRNAIRVMPVSFDTEYALSGETIALGSSNPLNYPILFEVFNERPMLAGNLEEYRGTLTTAELKRVMRARRQFLDGDTAKPDGEYLAWKEKEIKLAAYLSYPVNEALWEEEEKEKTLDIPVIPYRKAADTSGEELSDAFPHILLKTDEIVLGVVQVRDRFLLRLLAEEGAGGGLPQIRLDTQPVSLKQRAPGVHEVVIGYADEMPGKRTVEMELEGESMVFQLRFSRKAE